MRNTTLVKFEEKVIKPAAFNFAIDYKPWEENLPPQDYVQHGFEQGQKDF